MKKHFTELLTNYGPVDLIWVDQSAPSIPATSGTTQGPHQVAPAELPRHREQLAQLQPDRHLQLRVSDLQERKRLSRAWKHRPIGSLRYAGLHRELVLAAWLETHIRSADEVVGVVRKCNERRANYLLDVGPDR